MRRVVMLCALMCALSSAAVTATKEWVQTATDATLQAAKAYTDSHGVDPSQIKSIVNDEVGGTNTLLHGAVSLITDGVNTINADGSAVMQDFDGIVVEVSNTVVGHERYDVYEYARDPDGTSFGNGAWTWDGVWSWTHPDYGESGLSEDYESYMPGGGNDRGDEWWQESWGYVDNSYSGENGGFHIAMYAVKRTRNTKLATTNDIPTKANQVGAFSAAAGTTLQNTVNAWQSYWDGDDVRVTVTNYYGQTGMPHLYLEEKMPADETHDEPWFKVVWDEMSRWGVFLAAYAVLTNDVRQNYAERSWGVYDSSTGEYSPDGLLQISQEQVQIASGLAYMKTVTTGGCALWVLRATEPTTVSGVTSNGFFRIEDGDGNALFEIVKGDKRTVGATAADAHVTDGALVVTYNTVSGEHPTLYLATDLRGEFVSEEDAAAFASVSWSGTSGNYVATITPVGAQPKMFAKASYIAGGETYIKNSAPISANGGILCTDGVHKVRPVYNNGSITWEVVP